jgi:LTXXQ motif family protein
LAQSAGCRAAAVKNVRAALEDFYNSLSDEQKAQFNMIGRTARR